MRRYKYTIRLDFDDFTDWDLFGFGKSDSLFGEVINDQLWDWESPVYYDTTYALSEYKDDALEHLRESINATDEELENYDDEIEQEVLRALDTAWRDSVETNVFKLYHDRIESPDFDYSAFYYVDRDRNETKALWEASHVVYCFSEKLWRTLIYDEAGEWGGTLSEMREDAESDLAEYAIDNLHRLSTGNHSDFELAQDWADYDGWLDIFRDYSEVSYSIQQDRADTQTELHKREQRKQSAIKQMIKNHVPLIYRPDAIRRVS